MTMDGAFGIAESQKLFEKTTSTRKPNEKKQCQISFSSLNMAHFAFLNTEMLGAPDVIHVNLLMGPMDLRPGFRCSVAGVFWSSAAMLNAPC